jgi:rhodanese-related sulfurtransferase
MKRTLLGLLVLATTLMAEVTNTPVSKEFVESKKMKIIDIRTESEWREKGIIKDSYLLTFFDEQSHYDIDEFLAKLNKIVKKDEQFALICNSASRTKLVSNLLGRKLDYHVVNLIGGIDKLIKDGYKVEKYVPKMEDKMNPMENNITQGLNLLSSK